MVAVHSTFPAGAMLSGTPPTGMVASSSAAQRARDPRSMMIVAGVQAQREAHRRDEQERDPHADPGPAPGRLETNAERAAAATPEAYSQRLLAPR